MVQLGNTKSSSAREPERYATRHFLASQTVNVPPSLGISQSPTHYAKAQCKVVHSLQADSALASEWDDLWARANGHSHQSFTVCRHCWEDIARVEGQELLCVLIWKDERLVLAWPLVQYTKSSLRIVKPLTPCGGEANSILVEPGTDALNLARQAWTKLTAEVHLDVLYLPLVRVGSPLDQLVPDNPAHIAGQDAAPLARVSLEADFDSYRRSLSARSQKEMERSRRRILEMDNAKYLCFDPTENPDEAARLIDWTLVEKQKWAVRTRKSHTWVGSLQYRNFLVKSLTDTREVQKYRLFAFTVDNEPIVVKLLAICSGHLELVLGAYTANPQIAKLSPGGVLDEDCMRMACDLGLDVDFGTGMEPYKLFWSRGNADPLETYRIPFTWKGKLFLAAFNGLRRMRDLWKQRSNSTSS